MINLLYCGNDKVFDGLMISLLSASKHTSDAIRTYILTMDLSDVDEKYQPITEKHRKFLEDMVKEQNSESTVTLIDITDIYNFVFLLTRFLKFHTKLFILIQTQFVMVI